MRHVCEDSGSSRGAVDRWIKEGRFPKPVTIGNRHRVFIRTEYEQWKRDRIAGRDGRAA
ncbi:helix-turn-helix transcriptional regulator [Bradyrhizobium sp. RDT46]|uniref:helix-turn-helix transcriptional regulator n=1 Tax=Bradyrhizobium sp. RDT46 TaxID=3341829 RepID=UPI0035C6C07E